MGETAGQPGGLFTAVSPSAAAANAARTAPDPLTLRRRLVKIDLGQLAPAPDSAARVAAAGIEIAPRGVLTLNLFEDAVFTGLVERTAPTFSGGQALSGRLGGIEMGTVTLVVNGDAVAGTVRTPEATYRIRPAGNGLHAVSEEPAGHDQHRHQVGDPVAREPFDQLHDQGTDLGAELHAGSPQRLGGLRSAWRPWTRRRHCEQWPTSMSKRRTMGRTTGRYSSLALDRVFAVHSRVRAGRRSSVRLERITI